LACSNTGPSLPEGFSYFLFIDFTGGMVNNRVGKGKVFPERWKGFFNSDICFENQVHMK